MADAPVVDGTLLEAAKENIRPLAFGRRATALAGALATPHAQRDAERARFRSAIAEALASPEADVDWTVETYPAGHASLVPLLEEATRALRGRYAQDARYVRLWAAYAALVARPEAVWRFALANELGTSWAALYEALAGVLERAGRWAL
jgi:checkpoint serine/threonine-protein kinase